MRKHTIKVVCLALVALALLASPITALTETWHFPDVPQIYNSSDGTISTVYEAAGLGSTYGTTFCSAEGFPHGDNNNRPIAYTSAGISQYLYGDGFNSTALSNTSGVWNPDNWMPISAGATYTRDSASYKFMADYMTCWDNSYNYHYYWFNVKVRNDAVLWTPPSIVASFNFGPYTAIAPATIDAYDTSTGGTPTSWMWAIAPLVGVTVQNGTSNHATFRILYPGNYTVEMTAINSNDWDTASQNLTLGSWVNVTPHPSPTITVSPTVTGIPTLANLSAELPTIINRTAFLEDIQSGLIGNLTGPLTGMADDVGDMVEEYALAVVDILMWPMDFITVNLGVGLAIFDQTVDPLIHSSHWVLYVIGQGIKALPPGGEEIGSLLLMGGIIFTVMHGRKS